MLTFVLLLTVTVGAFAVLPGYEDVQRQYKIADYTLEFLHYDGRRGTGTFAIYNDPELTNDEVIRAITVAITIAIPDPKTGLVKKRIIV